MSRHVAICAIFVGSLLIGSPILAQSESPALAEELFRAGKQLMAEKRYAEACSKLAESQRIDPGGGTLVALALCHEAEGKTASAWAEFHEALSLARRDKHRSRERVATERIEALTPKLARLTLSVPKAVSALPQLVIRKDGVEIAPAAWDVAAPTDPGVHRIEALAEGKRAWSLEITLNESANESVEIPELLDQVPSPPPLPKAEARRVPPRRPKPTPVAAPTDGWRSVGYVSAGVAATGVVVGSIFGVRAISLKRDADETCPAVQCNDRDAVERSRDSQTAADVATVSFAVGALALVTAAYALLIHEPKATRTGTRRIPSLVEW